MLIRKLRGIEGQRRRMSIIPEMCNGRQILPSQGTSFPARKLFAECLHCADWKLSSLSIKWHGNCLIEIVCQSMAVPLAFPIQIRRRKNEFVL